MGVLCGIDFVTYSDFPQSNYGKFSNRIELYFHKFPNRTIRYSLIEFVNSHILRYHIYSSEPSLACFP